MDCSPRGSSIHGIFQARVLEWVAISFSRGSSQPRSPTLQADVLLSEPPGKLVNKTYLENNWERKRAIAFSTGEEGKEVGQGQEYFTSQT